MALAIRGMAKTLTPDRPRATMAILAAVLVLVWPSAWSKILAILNGGLFGLLFLKADTVSEHSALHIPIGRPVAMFCIGLFAVLLFGIPIIAGLVHSHTLALIDGFYRTGSLVFGGGHVVLPQLQTAVVSPGWIGKDMFLAGYGAAQAVPGPLFTFSAYLGTVMQPSPHGWIGGAICLISIYVPVPASHGETPFLGNVAQRSCGSKLSDGSQCSGRRVAPGGILQPRLDERHLVGKRFHPGPDCLRSSCTLEYSALGGGCYDRTRRGDYFATVTDAMHC